MIERRSEAVQKGHGTESWASHARPGLQPGGVLVAILPRNIGRRNGYAVIQTARLKLRSQVSCRFAS